MNKAPSMPPLRAPLLRHPGQHIRIDEQINHISNEKQLTALFAFGFFLLGLGV